MKRLVFFTFLCCFVYAQALKCEIGQRNENKIKQALSMCVKNNDTIKKIWEMSATSSSSSEETTDSDSSEDDDDKSETTPSSKASHKSRIKRATNKNRSVTTKTDNTKTTEPVDNNVTEETVSTEATVSENCIIHCILDHMELVDESGLPDHSKLVDGLLKDVSGRELHNFLEDSVDECYQEINDENNLDKCSYSSKLVKCLADKGRSNCSDWPAGSLPF